MTTRDTALPPSVFQNLDRASPLPLWSQIATGIERAITDGALPVESWIENEATLATRLRTSRVTTRRALDELTRRGLLTRQRGKGTQVVSRTVVRPSSLTSLYDDLVRLGRNPTTRILSRTLAPPSETSMGEQEAGPDDAVLKLRRLRYADGRPLAILTNWLPRLDFPLPDEELAVHGLYELLRFNGVTVRGARQAIGARRASAEESNLLELPEGSLVTTMTRRVTDPRGRLVDLGQHCYRPEEHVFEMTLTGP